jgi:excisionase family DNA binding protein
MLVHQYGNNQSLPVFYNPEEIAKVLRVTSRTVLEWLRTGKLVGYRPAGQWLISPDDLDRFIKGGSVTDQASAVAAPAQIADAAPVSSPELENVTKPVQSLIVASRPSNRAQRRSQQKRR